MLKAILLYVSVLSVFASEAQYTSTPISAQPIGSSGSVVVGAQTMQGTPYFQNVNTYSVANLGSQTANMPFGDYSLAEVQNFYSVVTEESSPVGQPIRKSPGVPMHAPMGEGVGALLVCSALYALYLSNPLRKKHKKNAAIPQ